MSARFGTTLSRRSSTRRTPISRSSIASTKLQKSAYSRISKPHAHARGSERVVVSGGVFLATCTLLNVYRPQKTFVDLPNFGLSLENPLPDGRGSVVLRVGRALPSRDRKEAGGR